MNFSTILILSLCLYGIYVSITGSMKVEVITQADRQELASLFVNLADK